MRNTKFMPEIRFYRIPESLFYKYDGCGYAIGAIENGSLVDFSYIRNIVSEYYEIESVDADNIPRQYFDHPLVIQEIEKIGLKGAPIFGILSCYEFQEID